MTFLELQNRVMTRLNLTSTDARSRIKLEINDRFREVCTSVNLARTRRGEMNFALVASTGSYTLACSKILTIYDRSILKTVLTETTVEQIRQLDPTNAVTGTPRQYAVEHEGADSITILLHPIPDAVNQLYADVIASGVDLAADGDIPGFPVDYHDILVRGVLSDELLKMEKMAPLAKEAEDRFEKRLAELRYYLLKSASKTTRQNDAAGSASGSATGGGSGSVPNGALSYTQSGLIAFVRGLLAPFSVQSGAAKVTNLDADMVDGEHATTLHNAGALTGALPAIDGSLLTGIVAPAPAESAVTFTDITTNNATSTKHGYAPKSPADATKFLNGAATEAFAAVKDSDLATTDVTTNDVTTAKHGFTPKAPNDVTKFLRGDATWAAPSGGAGVSTYAATLTNVISTNAITTFLSATITNAISNGDKIEITLDALIKQNTGGAAVGTLTITLGGQTLAITLPSWSDSATEWEERLVISLQCVGANVKVLDYLGNVNIANLSETLLFGDIPGRAMNNVGTITGPTLTAGQTLLLRFTPASSSANYYLKPQAACVAHTRN